MRFSAIVGIASAVVLATSEIAAAREETLTERFRHGMTADELRDATRVAMPYPVTSGKFVVDDGGHRVLLIQMDISRAGLGESVMRIKVEAADADKAGLIDTLHRAGGEVAEIIATQKLTEQEKSGTVPESVLQNWHRRR